MSRRQLTGFVDQRGEWRQLVDPDGPPTARQLLALARAGGLPLVEPDPAHRFTKAEAAAAIDSAVAAGICSRAESRRRASGTTVSAGRSSSTFAPIPVARRRASPARCTLSAVTSASASAT